MDKKRIFQILLILSAIYFVIYLIPTTSYWIKDCGNLKLTNLANFDSECSIGLWAIVYFVYGIPAWVLLIVSLIFYKKYKFQLKKPIQKGEVSKGGSLRVLGIIGSLIIPCVFIFDRGINHVLLRYPHIINFQFFYRNSFLPILLIILWNLFLYFFLFFPYYYFSWKKSKSNLFIKHWAKISTITIPIYFALETKRNMSIGNLAIEGWALWFVIVSVVGLGFLLSPLYYYAWKRR